MEVRDQFRRLSFTIGGMMIFPGHKIGGRMTINGARGCSPRINDRFDLTVECIRRHFYNEQSPLSTCLARYDNFFQLFGDFHGYVEFFLLQDLVTSDCSAVSFFMPFDDFHPWPVPDSVEAYHSYRLHAEEFIRARNRRMRGAAHASGIASGPAQFLHP